MKLFFRSLFKSIWLFLAWLLLRMWQQRFEVSPLPSWTLTVFLFILLFLITAFLSYRLLRNEEDTTRQVMIVMVVLVGGALFWEIGLTRWLSGTWSSVAVLWSWMTAITLLVQAMAVALASSLIRHRRTVQADALSAPSI